MVSHGFVAREFVHLHVHSQYSFLTSAVKVDDLAKRAKAQGMRAVALTDHANMYGAIRHYNAARSAGLTPIVGCEVNVVRKDASASFDHLVLLAATKQGYQNLIRLVSEGHLRSASPHGAAISMAQIAERSKGLVALTGCLGGVAAQRVLEYGTDSGEPILAELRDMFDPGHVFVELQDHGFPEQAVVNDTLVKAADRLGLPLQSFQGTGARSMRPAWPVLPDL